MYSARQPTYMWFVLNDDPGPRSGKEGRSDVLPNATALVLAVLKRTETIDRVFLLTDAGCMGWSWSDWFERLE